MPPARMKGVIGSPIGPATMHIPISTAGAQGEPLMRAKSAVMCRPSK